MPEPWRIRGAADDRARVDAVHAFAVREDVDVEELGGRVEEPRLAPGAVVAREREARGSSCACGLAGVPTTSPRRCRPASSPESGERRVEADVERWVDVREPVAPGAERDARQAVRDLAVDLADGTDAPVTDWIHRAGVEGVELALVGDVRGREEGLTSRRRARPRTSSRPRSASSARGRETAGRAALGLSRQRMLKPYGALQSPSRPSGSDRADPGVEGVGIARDPGQREMGDVAAVARQLDADSSLDQTSAPSANVLARRELELVALRAAAPGSRRRQACAGTCGCRATRARRPAAGRPSGPSAP